MSSVSGGVLIEFCVLYISSVLYILLLERGSSVVCSSSGSVVCGGPS